MMPRDPATGVLQDVADIFRRESGACHVATIFGLLQEAGQGAADLLFLRGIEDGDPVSAGHARHLLSRPGGKCCAFEQFRQFSEAGLDSCRIAHVLLDIRQELSLLHDQWLDAALAQGTGICVLNRPEIAQLVVDALRHFDGEHYRLIAWSVMPNHVHAIVQPLAEHDLEDIIHSWKSFTSKAANKLLGETGAFWQSEYYDHLIRDGEEFISQVRYVLENPSKAGCKADWTGSIYADRWDEILAAGRPEDGLGQDAPATILEGSASPGALAPSYDPFSYQRRATEVLAVMDHELGGDKPVRVFTSQEKWNAVAHKIAKMGDFKPEIVTEKSGVIAVDPRDEAAISEINHLPAAQLVTVADGVDLEVIAAFRMLAFRLDARHPILLKDVLTRATGESGDFVETLLVAARHIGSLLCDGIGDAILVQGEPAPGQSLRLSYNILQAAGTRIFKTDYVACPSCGRTLFNLQSTTQKIRASTGHLKGVRIAVMGCIVNGPGEMADADFGYVGGAPGKINLYVGKQPVKFNIPETEAVERLIDLIREHGKWIDAPVGEPVEV